MSTTISTVEFVHLSEQKVSEDVCENLAAKFCAAHAIETKISRTLRRQKDDPSALMETVTTFTKGDHKIILEEILDGPNGVTHSCVVKHFYNSKISYLESFTISPNQYRDAENRVAELLRS
jgi:hypothetical protein